ncbi:MAG: HAMP domain-containing protein, partial [Brachymonas sp.]|nr:HAMP domain-containing protein [Brachymonas sp.]
PAQFGLQSQAWVLQLEQSIPPELLQNAIMVQEANRDYQERALARLGLQRMFIGTLTLTLFLAVFGAVLLASLLAAQLARPLLYLAEGVRQVAAGDLSPKNIDTAQDELGGLTRSFAQMTQQLADTRQALTSSMSDLDASRFELQTILDNLTSGVLVLQANGTILSANPGASRILGITQAQLQGQMLANIPALQHMGEVVQQQFESLLDPEQTQTTSANQPAPATEPENPAPTSPNSTAHNGYWQHSMELNPPAHEGLQQDTMTLVLRGALLPEGAVPDMRLLVFEDISAIVSAQRAQAWGEVARRLAHEIKNPLTPIQLSAERLEMKLGGSLPAEQQAILSKSVRTIVDQVQAMKRLVNEFRDYARLPAAHLLPVDLNALITDILQLYEADNAIVPIVAELDPECLPVLADAEQLRQIIHNLLQNAQDAQEQTGHSKQAVTIQTQWRPATQRVRLSINDNGPGFPEHILQRAFEPYVTTKAKGTGLGLAVVKKIADEHGARISISNRMQDGEIQGAQISILLATQAPNQPSATGT